MGIEPAGSGARWTEARRVSDRESANQRAVFAKLRFTTVPPAGGSIASSLNTFAAPLAGENGVLASRFLGGSHLNCVASI